MSQVLPFFKVFLLLTLTGLSLFRIAPRAIREIHSWTDRIILSFLTGIAFYTIFFLLALGLLNLPLTTTSLWCVFFLVLASGVGVEIYRRRHHEGSGFEESEEPDPVKQPKKKILRDLVILIFLSLIFFFSLQIRMANGLRYPDKLLDADPYRHQIRTEALMETGHLSKYDPYIVGEVPIFELQGCYILAGALGLAGPFTSWQMWAWGSQIFGALSVVSLYLFTKLGLRSVLREDLGPPPQGKKGKILAHLHADHAASLLGLIAAAIWGASPVHILRTNAGFSEAYAIPLLAPTLLFYLWAAQSRIWSDFVWFGIFFTALAFVNPIPAVFIVPFFFVHATYVAIKTKDRRWILGNLLAGGIFFVCLMVWNWKFLATPLLTGMKATSDAGTTGIQKAIGGKATLLAKLKAGWVTFSNEIFKNLGFMNFGGKIGYHLFGKILKVGKDFQNVFQENGKFNHYCFVTLAWINDHFQMLMDAWAVLVGLLGSFWMLWSRRLKAWRINETTVFFFLSYAFFFFILFLIPFGFISFTSKYYRYLLPISLSLSVLTAYFLWRFILLIFHRDPRKSGAWSWILAALFILGFAFCFFVVGFNQSIPIYTWLFKRIVTNSRGLIAFHIILSLILAYGAWRLNHWLFAKDRYRVGALVITVFLALIVNIDGRTWGGWVLNCSPEEYSSADWLVKNTAPEDFVIANWYTGDYLRSLSKRRIIISDYPRVEVKVAKEKFDLKIPILPKEPAKMLEYIREHPGNYYLVTAQWGPWGMYDGDPHFKLQQAFGQNPKTMSKVYRIQLEPESESQPTSETSPSLQ